MTGVKKFFFFAQGLDRSNKIMIFSLLTALPISCNNSEFAGGSGAKPKPAESSDEQSGSSERNGGSKGDIDDKDGDEQEDPSPSLSADKIQLTTWVGCCPSVYTEGPGITDYATTIFNFKKKDDHNYTLEKKFIGEFTDAACLSRGRRRQIPCGDNLHAVRCANHTNHMPVSTSVNPLAPSCKTVVLGDLTPRRARADGLNLRVEVKAILAALTA